MEQRLNSDNYHIRGRLILAALGALCFSMIALQVTAGNTAAFDHTVDYAVYGLRSGFTEAVLIPITYMGNAATIVTVIAVLVLIPRSRLRIGVPAAVTGTVVLIFYKCLKAGFARERPDEALRLITQGGFSFPSGHSMNGIVCYGMIIFLVRRSCRSRRAADITTALLTLLILLIGFSRIFVGVHYVTDVLGGWSMGLCCLMLATVVMDRLVYPRYPGLLAEPRTKEMQTQETQMRG